MRTILLGVGSSGPKEVGEKMLTQMVPACQRPLIALERITKLSIMAVGLLAALAHHSSGESPKHDASCCSPNLPWPDGASLLHHSPCP